MWVLRVKTFSGCREELAVGWVSLELKVRILYCRKDTNCQDQEGAVLPLKKCKSLIQGLILSLRVRSEASRRLREKG